MNPPGPIDPTPSRPPAIEPDSGKLLAGEADPGALRWARLREVFERALKRPEAEREALVRAEAGDAEACREVLAMLAHAGDEDTQHWPKASLWADTENSVQPPPTLEALALMGLRLGVWRLTERLGLGGMGEVWAARRADGLFQGEAAIKLLRAGVGGPAVHERFAQEQQALARLSHPNIARLFDAGVTADGRPYFVMELVNGQALDAAASVLPLADRVRLILQLCDAVAYAHRQLLVHRDLKPGNVLVDEAGQVKLLDFGIAKALDPMALAQPDAAQLTAWGQRPYTPAWASPEQVRGEPIGTATDVYSLGVLLYTLITGQAPYGRSATTPAEVARAVLEEEPQHAPLEGDLGSIVLKAMEKEPERRYPSVEALQADLRAWLAGRPVSARPRNWRYVAEKFVRRNRVLVGVSALGLCGVLIGAGVAFWQAHRATQAQLQAEARLKAVKRFNRSVVLQMGQALNNLPGGMAIKETMLRDTLDSLEALAAEAQGDLDLLGDLAIVYESIAEIQGNDTGLSLGKGREAEANAARAIEYAQKALPAKQTDSLFLQSYANMHTIRALQDRSTGKLDEADREAEASVVILEAGLKRLPGDRELSGQLAQTWLYLGQFQDAGGQPSHNQPAQALPWFDKSAELFTALEAQEHNREILHELGTVQGSRSRSLANLGRLDEAYEAAALAVQFHERDLAADPTNLSARSGLAVELTQISNMNSRLGRFDQADAQMRRSWALFDGLVRDEGPKSKWVRNQTLVGAIWGRALAGLGRHAEAVPLFRNAFAAMTLPSGPNVPTSLTNSLLSRRGLLAAFYIESLVRTGQGREARSVFSQTVPPLSAMAARQTGNREAQVALARLLSAGDALPGNDNALLGSGACTAWRRAQALQALATDEASIAARQCPKGLGAAPN